MQPRHQRQDQSQAVTKRARQSKGLSKHGCITCKVRRVKCDEARPHCKRCIDTGRQCDGYKSNFVTITPGAAALMAATGTTTPSSQSPPFMASPHCQAGGIIEPLLVLDRLPPLSRLPYLSQNFTLVPHCSAMSNDYYASEAQATLDSAASEPSIRHALACLDALGAHYKQHGDPTRPGGKFITGQYPGFQLGLQEYTRALQALSGRISACAPGREGSGRDTSSGSDDEQVERSNKENERNKNQEKEYVHSLKCALLCGQLFISIETALNDIHAATRHLVQGLHIMHQYGTRCYVDAKSGAAVISKFATDPSLPDISLFVTKLFLTCPKAALAFPYDAAVLATEPTMADYSNSNNCRSKSSEQQQQQQRRRPAAQPPVNNNNNKCYQEGQWGEGETVIMSTTEDDEKEATLLQARKHLAGVAYLTLDLLRGIEKLRPVAAATSSHFSSSSPSSSSSSSPIPPELLLVPNQLTAQRRKVLETLEEWGDRFGESTRSLYQTALWGGGEAELMMMGATETGKATENLRKWKLAVEACFSTLFYITLKLSATLALQGPGGGMKTRGEEGEGDGDDIDKAWAEQSREMLAVAEIATGLMRRGGQ